MTRSTALTTWKEIAYYVGKSVRTVQRWERDFGLPVRRPNNASPKSPVLIETVDLDRWMRRTFNREQAPSGHSGLIEFHRNTRLIEQAIDLVHEHMLVIQRTEQIRLELQKSCLLYSAHPVLSQPEPPPVVSMESSASVLL